MWRKQRKKANNTWGSHLVTHDSTNQARRCLTSVIGREPVFSTWYGRRHQQGVLRLFIRQPLVYTEGKHSVLWPTCFADGLKWAKLFMLAFYPYKQIHIYREQRQIHILARNRLFKICTMFLMHKSRGRRNTMNVRFIWKHCLKIRKYCKRRMHRSIRL